VIDNKRRNAALFHDRGKAALALLSPFVIAFLVGVACAGPIDEHSPSINQPPSAGPIEQHLDHPPVQYPDAAPLILSMLGTWSTEADSRTFKFEFKYNLTIVMTASDTECIYSNFQAPEYSRDELHVTFHCVDESWSESGSSLFNFVRIGSGVLMIESALVEKEANSEDIAEGENHGAPPEKSTTPRLSVRVFFKSK
jgi:hypothetical protein